MNYSTSKSRDILWYLQPQVKVKVRKMNKLVWSGCCRNPRLVQESSEPAADTTSSHVRTAIAAKATASSAALMSAVIRHLCERQETWARCSSAASSLICLFSLLLWWFLLNTTSEHFAVKIHPLTLKLALSVWLYSFTLTERTFHDSTGISWYSSTTGTSTSCTCWMIKKKCLIISDKTRKANRQIKWVKSSFLLQWPGQQSSPEGKWRRARRPLQLQHWMSSSLEALSGLLVESFDSFGDSCQLFDFFFCVMAEFTKWAGIYTHLDHCCLISENTCSSCFQSQACITFWWMLGMRLGNSSAVISGNSPFLLVPNINH